MQTVNALHTVNNLFNVPQKRHKPGVLYVRQVERLHIDMEYNYIV